MAALNHVLAVTGADIVITSSWRGQGIALMQRRLRSWGVVGRVIGVTPYLPPEEGRGREIAAWLAWYRATLGSVDALVILDDDRWDLGELADALIQTTYAHGLTPELAQRAIARLGMTVSSMMR
jgi:hypothetical protein